MASQVTETGTPEIARPLPPGREGAIPMMAQVYVRLRHLLRDAEQQLQAMDGAQRDEDGAPKQATERSVLESRLASLRSVAEVAEAVAIGSRVIVGSTVYVRTGEDGPLEEYQLVLPTENDLAARKISFETPIGRALLGREAGDVAVVETPKGQREMRVMVVTHK